MYSSGNIIDLIPMLDDVCVRNIAEHLVRINYKDLFKATSQFSPSLRKNNNKMLKDLYQDYFNRRESSLSICSFDYRNVLLYNYRFLSSIDNNYINVTENPHLIESNWCYYNMSFNFDNAHYNKIIEKYFDMIDYENIIIAGGCFSNYTNNSDYQNLVNLFKFKKDIDIFVYGNVVHYIKLWEQQNISLTKSNLKTFI